MADENLCINVILKPGPHILKDKLEAVIAGCTPFPLKVGDINFRQNSFVVPLL